MKATLAKAIPVKTIQLGLFTLDETGLLVTDEGPGGERPGWREYQAVGDYIKRAHKAVEWWLADWIVYGDSRPEWKARIDAELGIDQLGESTVRDYRYIANAIPVSSRLDGVSFTHHQVVASLEPAARDQLLAACLEHGWTRQEFRREVRAWKRRGVITGQAELAGMFKVIYADPPWSYGSSGVITDNDAYGRTARHYDAMSIEQIGQLPVAAHARPDAVLFLWVTSPLLSACWPVIEAWGFEYKTSIVWDKVLHNFGNYVSVRHELLLICTRGSCLPDRPTPMPDSVQTIRRGDVHSEKPEDFRRLIERLYDGPYVELFARKQTEGWTCWGNQILAEVPA